MTKRLLDQSDSKTWEMNTNRHCLKYLVKLELRVYPGRTTIVRPFWARQHVSSPNPMWAICFQSTARRIPTGLIFKCLSEIGSTSLRCYCHLPLYSWNNIYEVLNCDTPKGSLCVGLAFWSAEPRDGDEAKWCNVRSRDAGRELWGGNQTCRKRAQNCKAAWPWCLLHQQL